MKDPVCRWRLLSFCSALVSQLLSGTVTRLSGHCCFDGLLASRAILGDSVHQQYAYKLRKNQSRLNILSEELDNLPMVALRPVLNCSCDTCFSNGRPDTSGSNFGKFSTRSSKCGPQIFRVHRREERT